MLGRSANIEVRSQYNQVPWQGGHIELWVGVYLCMEGERKFKKKGANKWFLIKMMMTMKRLFCPPFKHVTISEEKKNSLNK